MIDASKLCFRPSSTSAFMYGRASSSRPPVPTGPSEFDILKASHRFLREDDNPNTNADTDRNANPNSSVNANGSWGDRLAQKYYESLYREFAFALRWRTEEEVINSAGEETCGNTRCPLHLPSSASTSTSTPISGLKTVELPFVYEEHGEHKSALVKVVLCDACLKKLMWKREREKKGKERRMIEDAKDGGERHKEERVRKERKRERGTEPAEEEQESRPHEKRRDRREEESSSKDRRKVRSRSRSPSRHR
ncbi:hypothetical protein A7U60_g1049 [Sanghuangporus baumii]|uniref:Uncharacterized protein n=1 Tax=Sanghuangporus baumii TaxID=108892 RepID=A0A9Q5N9P2_SANBA|nr:hypothetical protein A7U60_g1049 [Sanghuangporus baumii]